MANRANGGIADTIHQPEPDFCQNDIFDPDQRVKAFHFCNHQINRDIKNGQYIECILFKTMLVNNMTFLMNIGEIFIKRLILMSACLIFLIRQEIQRVFCQCNGLQAIDLAIYKV